MNTATIQIRTDLELKNAATAFANQLGLSLSSLVKSLLKDAIKSKSVTLNSEETPSPRLIKSIKQAKKDYENGDYYSFNTEEESINFLREQAK